MIVANFIAAVRTRKEADNASQYSSDSGHPTRNVSSVSSIHNVSFDLHKKEISRNNYEDLGESFKMSSYLQNGP